MSVVIGGVTAQEIVEGLQEGVHEQGPVAQKKYLVDWNDRYAFANAMLGLVSGTGGASPVVTLTNPQQYPQSLNMWAREIVIEGKGKPTQGPVQLQFPKAIVTVSYGVPQFGYLSYPDQSIDPTAPYIYATQEVHLSREQITIPNAALVLANGHKLNATSDYALQSPIATLTVQLHRVPYLPWSAIYTALKRPLNNATFLGVNAGYLMFLGADTREQASTDGTFTQELTLNFTARALLRWDEIYDPDGVSGPQQVQYNGAALLLRTDLSTLIPTAYHG